MKFYLLTTVIFALAQFEVVNRRWRLEFWSEFLRVSVSFISFCGNYFNEIKKIIEIIEKVVKISSKVFIL